MLTGSPAARKGNTKLTPVVPKSLKSSEDLGRRSTIALPVNPISGTLQMLSIVSYRVIECLSQILVLRSTVTNNFRF